MASITNTLPLPLPITTVATSRPFIEHALVRVRVRVRVRVEVRVRVRVRVGAWMSQHREQSQVGRFTPRPHFIVLTIAQRAHYKAESETACRVNLLKLVSPNQPDLQQLWGQSTSKPNALSLHEQAPLVGYSCGPSHRSSGPGS